VNILDENIPADQRQLLEHWRIGVRQIGLNIGRRGMLDDEIIPCLLRQRRPTIFTRDSDFYRRTLCHPRYCLVYMAVDIGEVASFVRRMLRHAALNTVSKRLGAVVRVSSTGLTIWRPHVTKQLSLQWKNHS
jgi:hypothetical protein